MCRPWNKSPVCNRYSTHDLKALIFYFFVYWPDAYLCKKNPLCYLFHVGPGRLCFNSFFTGWFCHLNFHTRVMGRQLFSSKFPVQEQKEELMKLPYNWHISLIDQLNIIYFDQQQFFRARNEPRTSVCKASLLSYSPFPQDEHKMVSFSLYESVLPFFCCWWVLVLHHCCWFLCLLSILFQITIVTIILRMSCSEKPVSRVQRISLETSMWEKVFPLRARLKQVRSTYHWILLWGHHIPPRCCSVDKPVREDRLSILACNVPPSALILCCCRGKMQGVCVWNGVLWCCTITSGCITRSLYSFSLNFLNSKVVIFAVVSQASSLHIANGRHLQGTRSELQLPDEIRLIIIIIIVCLHHFSWCPFPWMQWNFAGGVVFVFCFVLSTPWN